MCNIIFLPMSLSQALQKKSDVLQPSSRGSLKESMWKMNKLFFLLFLQYFHLHEERILIFKLCLISHL